MYHQYMMHLMHKHCVSLFFGILCICRPDYPTFLINPCATM